MKYLASKGSWGTFDVCGLAELCKSQGGTRGKLVPFGHASVRGLAPKEISRSLRSEVPVREERSVPEKNPEWLCGSSRLRALA